MTKDKTVSCYDDHARYYDAYQRAVVPPYQEMLEMVGETCSRYLPADSRIIDLGCGTGNASLAVLNHIPARICLIDGSLRMLEVASSKIDELRPNSILGIKCVDLSSQGWSDGLGCSQFDGIISTLVLEHLPFDSYVRTIVNCHRLLKPGGWLIAVEGYQEEDSDMLEWFVAEMESRRRALAPEMSDFVSDLRCEKETHYFCSKAQKAAWWQEAGLGKVNVLWQYLSIALMAGRKPP
jgi:tRNA (cmo5U34)-methyltransferase